MEQLSKIPFVRVQTIFNFRRQCSRYSSNKTQTSDTSVDGASLRTNSGIPMGELHQATFYIKTLHFRPTLKRGTNADRICKAKLNSATKPIGTRQKCINFFNNTIPNQKIYGKPTMPLSRRPIADTECSSKEQVLN